MKTIISLFSLVLCMNTFSQSPQASIESGEVHFLFRGFENKVWPAISNNEGRTIGLTGENVSIQKAEKGDYFVVKPTGNVKEVTLNIVLIDGSQVDVIKSLNYQVMNLPDPDLYLGRVKNGGSVDLSSFEVNLKYPVFTPLRNDFQILSWEAQLPGNTILGHGNNLSEAKKSLEKLPDGSTFTILARIQCSDGIARLKSASWIIRRE